VKKIIFTFFLVILIVIITLVIHEIIGQQMLGDKIWIKDVDHRMRPNGRGINGDGIRCEYTSNYFKAEDFNIIFLGDSFVFGYDLPANKAFPEQFKKKTNTLHPEKKIKVANFGWTSSSPLLSYRLLKDIGKKYNPDVVILCVDMTDFQDDIRYSRLLGETGIYRLRNICPITMITISKILKKMNLKALHDYLFGVAIFDRFFTVNKPLTETRPSFSYIQKSINNINNYCKKELDAKFILMILPRSFQYNDRECPNNWEKKKYTPFGPYVYEPFKYFESIKKQVDYPIYSLLPDFQNTHIFPTCFIDDPHWNGNGHWVAAEAAYKYCSDDGLFK